MFDILEVHSDSHRQSHAYEQEHRMGSTDLHMESDELYANYADHMDKREKYGLIN